MDRGLPDVLAYMDYAKIAYSDWFNTVCNTNIYDQIFVLAPWQDIYKSDSERYENFDQAIEIHDYLLQTYSRFGYHLIDVPFGSIASRTDFILGALNL